ncbi:MAG: GNAT family N-acetyltransferase, partial [Anaerolineales bacterium]|nr:GNAT family N-acetyltransferase [Anaerolineales bacterium]
MDLPGIPQDIGNGLTIKACESDQDIELIVALNAEMHGENEAKTVQYWLNTGHPQITPEGWLYVQDEKTGLAAATLCLIPLTWRYGPVPLAAAELGFVATRPAFQKQGLQRALSGAFDRIALANGYTLAGIEGIPYFYRQFGYEYAVPMDDGMHNCRYTFVLEQIPPAENISITFRPASRSD